jgi:hypothetical protein
MGAYRKFLTLSSILFMAISFSRCILPECQDFDCPTGESCIVQDGQPMCSGDSTGTTTGGNNLEGESCDVDADCASGLVCLPDLSGNDVCTPQG